MTKILNNGRFGSHGKRVRVNDDGDRYRVSWRSRGLQRQKSWPRTPEGRKEAIAWAKGFSERRHEPAQIRRLEAAYT